MSTGKFTSAVDLSGPDRVQLFIRKVKESQELWGLYVDGWAEEADGDGKKGLVVWPDEQHARLCAKDKWGQHSPKSIKLSSFKDRWVDKLVRMRLKVAVFPTPFDGPVFIEPTTLRSELS
ncbi:DUF2750 domain-containing protein [Bremerella cremea]|uniref:DUF2750 domain-containing protein n=1 Tax=Bremerella cremea TaxID=1031537 RepID=A0A368KX83_9BACT|nr:DUF2750 domain-containing protein [Bremerella cremea]RCS52979.1 DUF2750 domain-containing protein [Bremerella cremea]